MTHLPRTLIALSAALAALGLAACDRPGENTSGARSDTAVAKTERAPADVAGSVKSAVSDASITASVNAELARDNELSALRIDVDTNAGKVALKGTAPNAEARERAAKLARAVTGVTDVDNQLAVKG